MRVLVVDDNVELAENLAEILGEEGFDVRVSTDPERALAEARSFAFDVALLDVRMPGMDGVELYRRLRTARPSARFVLMTAYTKDERLAQAFALGVRTVLPKPVPIPSLLETLPDLVSGSGYVLVVEDDEHLAPALVRVLSEAGYTARRARTLAEARDAIANERPLAVFADVRLPDGDGSALVTTEHDGPPVVLMTGYATEGAERVVREAYGERGRILEKPFPPGELLAILEELAPGGEATR